MKPFTRAVLGLLALVPSLACGKPTAPAPDQPPTPRSAWVATASSAGKDGDARFAFDGDMKTRWGSDFSDKQWLRVDFTRPRLVSGVIIHWEKAFGQDYDICLSEDGKNWTVAAEVRGGDGDVDEVLFAERRARYLEMRGIKRGSVWGYSIFELEPLGPAEQPALSATSTAEGSSPKFAMDADTSTFWRSATGGEQALVLDLKKDRSLGGIGIFWGRPFAGHYAVETSNDSRTWTRRGEAKYSNGDLDVIYIPATSCRWLRILCLGGPDPKGYAIAEVYLKGPKEAWDPTRHFESVASRLPLGSFPRWVTKQQGYWTITGVPQDEDETLLSEDGVVEPFLGAQTTTPFLIEKNRVFTAHDFVVTHSLAEGYMPLPEVKWAGKDLNLTIAACGFGSVGAAGTLVRYQLANGGAARRVRLVLATRPLELNPPWQFGRFQPIKSASFSADNGRTRLDINGRPYLCSLTPPTRTLVVGKAEGDVLPYITGDQRKPNQSGRDNEGLVTTALAYDLDLPANGAATVVVFYPQRPGSPQPQAAGETPEAVFARVWQQQTGFWRDQLGGWRIDCPLEGLEQTVRANIGFMLLTRDRRALQPGVRSYNGSWIRDGAIEAFTLLCFNRIGDAFDYLEWFSNCVGSNGYVPPLVHFDDNTCPDWSRTWKEFDAFGEYVYAIRHYYEFTRDRAFLARHYPTVVKVIAYQDSLVAQGRAVKDRNSEYYGLLPESNSHEGYVPPRHSYWDDFWAIHGLTDAAALADVMGDAANARRFRQEAQRLQTDLFASMRKVVEKSKIQNVPGCVELADNDLAATAVALTCNNQVHALRADPVLGKALESGFDIFMKEIADRLAGRPYDCFTQYQSRIADALMRDGRRDDGMKVIEYFLGDPMRPRGWRQWAETCYGDARRGAFLGDMPHTWAGAGFVCAVRSAFVYEDDGALVLGAGVTEPWIEKGVGIENLATWFGPLSYTARADGSQVTLNLSGSAAPPKGFLLNLPGCSASSYATVGGRKIKAREDGTILCPIRLPAQVVVTR